MLPFYRLINMVQPAFYLTSVPDTTTNINGILHRTVSSTNSNFLEIDIEIIKTADKGEKSNRE
jgi:hypothetical protein